MKNRILNIIVLILLSSFPYLNTLKGEFVSDDTVIVLGNENVKGKTTLYDIFLNKNAMPLSGEIYRPIRDISYRLEWLIGGKNPAIFHATNILLHVVTTLAAFWFLRLLIKDDAVSFLAASIFAVHPIHTESVSWIKGRDDLFFTFFYMLSFIMFLKYEDADDRKRLYLLSSASLFILSLFSKEMAVTLPISIVLYQAIFKRFKFYALLPFFIIAVMYMGLRTYVLGQVAQQEYWGGGILPTMLTMMKGVVQYVRLSFFPINQCADYYSFPISTGVDLAVIFSLSVLSALVISLLVQRSKVILFGGLFFFLALLPVSNIIPIKILIAERFLYLPSLGFCVLLAVVVDKISPRPDIFRVFGGIIVSMLLLLTIQRNHVWLDEFSLWSDTLIKAPDNPRTHYAMGTVYDSKGLMDNAIKEYNEALRYSPDTPYIINALGLAYYKKGTAGDVVNEELVEEARRMYEKVLKLDASHRDARYNLALLLHEQGLIDEAIKEYTKLLEYKLSDFDALNSLGYAYFQKGLFKEALVHYRKAMSIDPGAAAPYNNIGMVYAMAGETEEAEKWFRKGLDIEPRSAEAHYNLGLLYQGNGRMAEAIKSYKRAIEIRPDYGEARSRLKELR